MYSFSKKFVKDLPLIRTWIDKRRYKRFCSKEGFASFYGVFDSFTNARSKCPTSQEFNHRNLADDYANSRIKQLFNYDYPAIFWLNKAFSENATGVFDIGGSVGVHYYAYQQILDYPVKMNWVIFETPEVVRVGHEIATLMGGDKSQLFFTDSLEINRVKADIWFCAGALQYIENAHPCRLLVNCGKRPTYIILNKLPVYNGEDFVVAQNIGNNSYAPAYVYNRSRLVSEFESMGYKLLDSWKVLEYNFYLPGYPEKSFDNLSGMAFKAMTDRDHRKRNSKQVTREE